MRSFFSSLPLRALHSPRFSGVICLLSYFCGALTSFAFRGSLGSDFTALLSERIGIGVSVAHSFPFLFFLLQFLLPYLFFALCGLHALGHFLAPLTVFTWSCLRSLRVLALLSLFGAEGILRAFLLFAFGDLFLLVSFCSLSDAVLHSSSSLFTAFRGGSPAVNGASYLRTVADGLLFPLLATLISFILSFFLYPKFF